MLWLAILFSAQFAFGVVASGVFSIALLITIPELIAFWMIYSNAKSAEPDSCGGLKLLKGYYNFLFIFMIVVGSLAVLAGIAAGIFISAAGDRYSSEFSGSVAGVVGTVVLVLAVVLLPIIFGAVCFFIWAGRKYVRSLYHAVTGTGKPEWSVFIAVILFLAALNAFSSSFDALVMTSSYYTGMMSQLLSQLPARLAGYLVNLMSSLSGYKAVFSSLQAMFSCGASVLAGIIVLKLRKAD